MAATHRIRSQGGFDILTVPVRSAGRSQQMIAECQLANSHFARKILGAVRANYGKAEYFDLYFEDFSSALLGGVASGSLLELNLCLIEFLATGLGVSTPSVIATSLRVDGRRGEHVAGLCERVSATTYLSPAGAEQYLLEDKAAFDERGIRVLLHRYDHPEYKQRFSPFVSHMSALDLLFNTGPESGEIMRAGRLSFVELSNEMPDSSCT